MPSSPHDHSLNALPPGSVVGDYTIESELGSGGFSIVYLARHNLVGGGGGQDWWLALKEYLPAEVAGRDRDGSTVRPTRSDLWEAFQDGLRRFKEEAQLLVRFRRLPNVVDCLNLVEANGTAYLAMEYDDGLPLSRFLQLREEQGFPFSEDDLLAVVVPLLECLAEVHRAGVLHRDIKPGNIFVRRPDDVTGRPAEPMLLDFGAAKQDYLGRHSRSGAPYTPGYAALEQTSSMHGMGPWTDIYALGATMWRMAAGGNPAHVQEHGPSPVDVLSRSYALGRGEPDPMPSAAELGAGRFSAHVLEMIDSCLEIYPEDRPQDSGELLGLLETRGDMTDSGSAGTIIGIDLGTSYSCVSIVDGETVRVIENSEGSRTTPSVVAYTDEGEILVGQSAKRQAVVNPTNTLAAVKRLMGSRFHDEFVQRNIGKMAFDIVEAPNGNAWVSARGRHLAPAQVSAEILKKMKLTAEDYLGESVAGAVISVPAYFNLAQRQAVKDAGRIAGLEVRRVVSEPDATAVAYAMTRHPGDSKIAIYDLGGGNFGISIIEIAYVDEEHQIEVLSTNGDNILGGEDFDLRIVDHLASAFEEDTGLDLSGDLPALLRLKEAAEEAKIELSSRQHTEINLPYLVADQTGHRSFVHRLTREKIESLVEDLVDLTIGSCSTAMVNAGLSIDDIDDVILAGGQTRMPLVREKVKEFFEVERCLSVNLDESVATGAAIWGALMSGQVIDCLIFEVTPLSLGIEAKGGAMSTIIPRNTTIPTRKQETVPIATDKQTAVTIHVLQGEHPLAAQNKSLGRFDLTGLPPAPRREREVEVSLDVHSDGTLDVSARDSKTKLEQSMEIKELGGLSESEIKRMINDG